MIIQTEHVNSKVDLDFDVCKKQWEKQSNNETIFHKKDGTIHAF